MNSILLKLFFAVGFSFFALVSFGQDTASSETYDIVYLKDGGVLWGEIKSFDEPSGLLVFEDRAGRVYSLGREEYKYFRENQVITKKTKRPKVIHPRKVEDFEFSLGFGWTSIEGPSYEYSDSNSSLSSSFSYIPIVVKIAGGKHLNATHFVGGTAEFSIVSSLSNYLNAGLRYIYTFDSEKRNALLYLPIEAKYFAMKATEDVYALVETESFNMNLNSLGLSLGTGVQFNRPNMRSFSLEAKVTKHFPSDLEVSDMPTSVNYSVGEASLFSGSLVFLYNL
ncbi:MAG: hypothetical protein HKP14_04905 [Bacteroidia bacterium]|nr:hypothetical protein [Bacteroidia bacterium]